MNLATKASTGLPRRDFADAGYAMAALLVGMAVMAILLSAVMPTWSHMVRREKEEELVFRGTQYARAINQYQRKFANASPASLDVLIEERMLRKKYRDPLATGKDSEFQMLYLGSPAGSRGMGAGPGAGRGSGTQAGAGTQGGAANQPGQIGSTFSTTPSGGIVGVTSKNTGTSIRLYKGKSKYNEWQFIGMEMSAQAGPGGAGPGGPGGPQRGGPGGREGGIGGPGSRGGFGGRGGGRGDFGGPDGLPGGGRGPSP